MHGSAPNHPNRRGPSHRGFTLVELLVVVTLIVILMSILAPAIAGAMYQAELTICGTQVGQVARGAISYATEHKRMYPQRQTLSDWSARRRPFMIRDNLTVGGIGATGTTPDDRPMLRGLLGSSLKALLDPLSPRFNIDHEANAITSANYTLWFGMSYEPTLGGGKGLFKLGGRLEWRDNSRGRDSLVSSSVLVSDWDLLAPVNEGQGSQSVINSHPDDAQVMAPYAVEPGEWAESGNSSVTARRGAVDNNFAYDDGSTQRIGKIEWNDAEMARVPYDYWAAQWTTTDTGVWLHLPR